VDYKNAHMHGVMSERELLAKNVDGPRLRRRRTTAVTSEATADAIAEGKKEADVSTPPLKQTMMSVQLSTTDVCAAVVVSLTVIAIAASVPQFSAIYRAFTAEAAAHDVPGSLWVFLKAQYHLLALPGRGRDAAAAAAPLRGLQRTFAEARAQQALEVHSVVDAKFARLAADTSFTRYGSTRIFFRPLRRRIYVDADTVATAANMTPPPVNTIERDAQGDAYVMTWGMAEIDPLTDTLAPALAARLECGRDGRTRMQVMRTQRSLETGVRVYSSYASADAEDAEELVARGPCLARVMALMCAGDTWEVFCPPEAGPSNTTREAWRHRIDVRSVPVNVASVQWAEAELDYVTRQLPLLERAPHNLDEASRQELEAALEAAPRVTRAALLQKVLGP
jgi:hypothetical protein